jgi:hypothetical protein
MTMRISILAAAWLAAQLSIGLLAVLLAGIASRRGGQPFSAAARRAILPAFLTGVVLGAICWAASDGTGLFPGTRGTGRVLLWLHALVGSGAVAGCYLLVFSGWLERRGLLRAARRIARQAGWLAAGACVLQLASGWALIMAGPETAGSPPAGWPLLAASLLIGSAAGGSALLAGLSGKPRPAAYGVAVLLAFSTLAWLAGSL